MIETWGVWLLGVLVSSFVVGFRCIRLSFPLLVQSASRCPICTACALDSTCFFSHSVSFVFSVSSCCPVLSLRANSIAEMLCNLACSWICSLSSWSIRTVKLCFRIVLVLLLLCNLTGRTCIMVSSN